MNADHSPLMSAFDAFMQRVWSDGEQNFEDALVGAIDDWLADMSASYNDSKPFQSSSPADDLGRVLVTLASAVASLRSLPGVTVQSTAQALGSCLDPTGNE